MENNPLEHVSNEQKARELIKPRKIEDVYADAKTVEALCGEYGSGTDCRFGNSSIDTGDNDLLF
ncbi:hypothetical protein [uncultured Chitinophaga sp.]|jgi:hypothetical protein|uniref:hypothetical protein n=1 Tax=uncultured Chitinophaga sp. TaxID=339340 RepID=UPI0026296118|nr:hypothetical protein [uncultured Chitinophaga sp.]